MTDKEFIRIFKNLYSCPTTDRGATLSNAIINKLNEIEEKLDVLEIIKEKNVDIEYIKTCFYDEKGGLKEYNSWVGHDEDKELTEEQFNKLKRWLEKNGK